MLSDAVIFRLAENKEKSEKKKNTAVIIMTVFNLNRHIAALHSGILGPAFASISEITDIFPFIVAALAITKSPEDISQEHRTPTKRLAPESLNTDLFKGATVDYFIPYLYK